MAEKGKALKALKLKIALRIYDFLRVIPAASMWVDGILLLVFPDTSYLPCFLNMSFHILAFTVRLKTKRFIWEYSNIGKKNNSFFLQINKGYV